MISASVNGRLGKQNKPWNEKNLGNNDLWKGNKIVRQKSK